LEGQKKIIHVSRIGTRRGTFLSTHLLKHSKPLIQQYHAQRDQGICESSSGSKDILGATCTHITLTLYWPDYIGGQSFCLTIHPSDAYEYRIRDEQEFCGSMPPYISQCYNNYIVTIIIANKILSPVYYFAQTIPARNGLYPPAPLCNIPNACNNHQHFPPNNHMTPLMPNSREDT